MGNLAVKISFSIKSITTALWQFCNLEDTLPVASYFLSYLLV